MGSTRPLMQQRRLRHGHRQSHQCWELFCLSSISRFLYLPRFCRAPTGRDTHSRVHQITMLRNNLGKKKYWKILIKVETCRMYTSSGSCPNALRPLLIRRAHYYPSQPPPPTRTASQPIPRRPCTNLKQSLTKVRLAPPEDQRPAPEHHLALQIKYYTTDEAYLMCHYNASGIECERELSSQRVVFCSPPKSPQRHLAQHFQQLLNAGSGVKFDAESTYHNTFPAYPIEPRPRPPPVAAEKNPARFDGTTTNDETYKAHIIEPRQVWHCPGHDWIPSPWQAVVLVA